MWIVALVALATAESNPACGLAPSKSVYGLIRSMQRVSQGVTSASWDARDDNFVIEIYYSVAFAAPTDFFGDVTVIAVVQLGLNGCIFALF